jgi:hypothetical protein
VHDHQEDLNGDGLSCALTVPWAVSERRFIESGLQRKPISNRASHAELGIGKINKS